MFLKDRNILYKEIQKLVNRENENDDNGEEGANPITSFMD